MYTYPATSADVENLLCKEFSYAFEKTIPVYPRHEGVLDYKQSFLEKKYTLGEILDSSYL